MATPTTSARDYCGVLAKSKLLPAGEVEALHQRWLADAGGADDRVEAFAKYLVGKRVVTPWQAAMVQRGRADGFFLDGYKILDQVGKGHMGGVYKAVHSLGQVVALKILPASRAKDARVLARFAREAKLLTQLDHPNVVRAFQLGDSGGRHYIAMEFLEGETLDDVLTRRKRLPPGEAVRLMRQVLDGLQHLHEQRTIHRDLKPTNLMVLPAHARGTPDTTWDATLKILDIGLGRELFLDADSAATTHTQLTVEGAVVGTPDYMAPEQAKDARTSDIRADIYSVGCVLYHCLTGRTPFPDATIMAQMLRHATDDPDPLAATVPDAPPGLQATLDMMLKKNPAERFPTPEAAAKALKRFETTGVGAPPAATPVNPAYRQWLQTESGGELPVVAAPGQPARAAARPGTASAAPLPPATKPGTAPAAPLPPRSKVGTGPAAPLPTGGRPVVPPPAYPGYPPAPVAPAPAWQPAGPYPAPDLLDDGDFVEVELVTNLPPAPVPPPPPPVYVRAPDDRPLWELDRRDLILLAAGGGSVIGALGLGYGLARLIRPASPKPEAEEK